MEKLLSLQNLDLKIEALKQREEEIPKQKRKFDIQRERLKGELEESQSRCKKLQIEQRECEGEIEQRQAEIRRKDSQLLEVKKNEEYQALLHEIDLLKKQIGIKEERVIAIMLETDEAKARLEADKKRIAGEQKRIEEECARIDEELAAATAERHQMEARRKPLEDAIDRDLMIKYIRIRKAKKSGPAVVPLRGESCSGCNMAVTAQVVNEILEAKEKMDEGKQSQVHACRYCGRLLYASDDLDTADIG